VVPRSRFRGGQAPIFGMVRRSVPDTVPQTTPGEGATRTDTEYCLLLSPDRERKASLQKEFIHGASEVVHIAAGPPHQCVEANLRRDEMNISRRKLLSAITVGASLHFAQPMSWAQAYPSRPIRLVVGFQPGTAPDVIARLLGQKLAEQLRQPVIIENQPGASGNIAAEFVVRAPPDGYTLLQLTSVNSWNAALYDNLKFDLLSDLAPIASLYRGFGVVVVHPSFKATTLAELIAYARENPGKLIMGSAGVGTPQHLYGEMFKQMCGIDMLHVPYRGGGRALTDLFAGHVHVLFDPLVTSMPHIKSNELRALAVTSPTRLEILPNVPAVAEVVPGYQAEGWQGLAAPANTPTEIIARLNQEVATALADPSFATKISELGGIPFSTTPSEFQKFIAEFTATWSSLIKSSNIRR
jgi:tripartite-type tricarboxylate transporter receptor subunit TctC